VSVRQGRLAAGRHTLAWNGRDAAGQPLAPGVYLARVSGAERSSTTRFVRVN
jgi:hypothetical protein